MLGIQHTYDVVGLPWDTGLYTVRRGWHVARRTRVNGAVSVFGRGNKIKGAAAYMGLTTSLNTGNGSILLISISPRNGDADNINTSGTRVRCSACSVLVGGIPTENVVVRARFGGLFLLPTGVGLTNTRLRLTSRRSEFCTLGGTVSPLTLSFSCVVVSYPPDLKLLDLGTLTTSSALVIPLRYRCCTLRNLDRLLDAIHAIGRLCGRRLRLRNIVCAVCSDHLGLGRRIVRRMGGCFPGGTCGAVVPHSIGLTRTPDFKGPIVCCRGCYGTSFTCGGLTSRVVGDGE